MSEVSQTAGEVLGHGDKQSRQTEHSIVRGILTKLRALGAFTIKFHGTEFGVSGTPDILIQWQGVTVWYEVKQPGKNLTPIQRHRHMEIRQVGGQVVLVHSWEEVEADLRYRKLLGRRI